METKSLTETRTTEKTITIKTKKITIHYEIIVTAITSENAAITASEIIPKKVTIKEKGKDTIEKYISTP